LQARAIGDDIQRLAAVAGRDIVDLIQQLLDFRLVRLDGDRLVLEKPPGPSAII
jgi:hypothetical protein